MKRKSHYPKTLPEWKAILELPKNDHHHKLPIIPEVFLDIMCCLNEHSYGCEESLHGEISHGMYESYINLLCSHKMVKRLKGKQPLAIQVKPKKWIVIKPSRHVLTAKGKRVLSLWQAV